MGAGISSPVDPDTEARIKTIMSETLSEFSLNFTKAFASELVKKAVAELSQEKSDRELLTRPKEAQSKDPIRTGWATKEGAVVKNWKKRFFVVRSDYKIEYYDKEETFKAGGSPKGTINPSGYWVETDCESKFMKRLNDIATKLKVDLSSLPQPKGLPPNTLGLLKDRRRDWFIQFETPEEKMDWAWTLRSASYWAESLNVKDASTRAAFKKAYWKTADARGLWWLGYWASGTEEERLSDLIFYQLYFGVMDNIYASIADKVSNVRMRSTVQEKVESGMGSTVTAAVTPAWATASKAIESVRPTLEAKIKENIAPLVEAQKSLREKIVSGISEKVNPPLASALEPLTKHVVPIIARPITEALRVVIGLFDVKGKEAVSSISSGQDENQVWRGLALLPRLTSTLKDVNDVLDALKELLDLAEKVDALKQIADSFENIVNQCRDGLRTLLDSAFYTMQQVFAEKAAGGDKAGAAAAAHAETMKRLLHDSNIVALEIMGAIFAIFIGPIISKGVTTPCLEVVAPLQEMIPGPLKDVVDLEDNVKEVIAALQQSAINAVLQPHMPAF